MADEPVFVARDRELAALDAFLERALAGEGQICLLSGSAGTGKTALAREFCRRVQFRRHDVVVAIGNCDAQTGMADPYLPFREALDLLVGNVDARLAQGRISAENAKRLGGLLVLSAQVIADLAPDLVGLFLPGGTIIAKVGKAVFDKGKLADSVRKRLEPGQAGAAPSRDDLDQAQIFEQYVNVLHALAEKQPLILVLEDLQWIDPASVGLLFRLARRLAGSRLLVLGTFRGNDLALGRAGERHPLEPVIAEMKRYQGDIVVDLDQAVADRGREFVDAFLDSQLNCLDDVFRDALARHTGGQPLFTVELVEHLRASRRLIRDNRGCWLAAPDWDWADLPARVEGVIEERIGRLSGELREALDVASVEGETFTAEVVARVRSRAVRDLVRQLSGELQREHRLVVSEGVQRTGIERLSRYRFSHNLLQAYLYAQLDEVELSYLHEDVGHALEALHGDRADDVAVQLARHFEHAGLADKARHYLQAAGEQAAARFAHVEALAYLERALALTPEADAEARYQMLLTRERVLHRQGDRAAQERDLQELRRLASRSADPGRLSYIALRQAAYALSMGDHTVAAGLAAESARLANEAGDALAAARAEHRWGRACWQGGDYAEARSHLDAALAVARAQDSARDEAPCLYDLGVVANYVGDHAQAMSHLKRAVELYAALEDRHGQIRCGSVVGIVLDDMGAHAEAIAELDRALALSREVGWRQAEARILLQSAVGLLALGSYAGARARCEQAIDIGRQIGDEGAVASSLDSLGLIAAFQGQPGPAVEYYGQALAIHRAEDNRRGQGYALTHLGYAHTALNDPAAALDLLGQALAIRRELQTEGLAVDTLAGMAQALCAQGDLAGAQAHVADVLAWMGANGTESLEYPLQVYLVCHRVLDSAGAHETASRVLEAGHELLMARAAHIQDATLRVQFLRDIPFNRELEELWQARLAT